MQPFLVGSQIEEPKTMEGQYLTIIDLLSKAEFLAKRCLHVSPGHTLLIAEAKQALIESFAEVNQTTRLADQRRQVDAYAK